MSYKLLILCNLIILLLLSSTATLYSAEGTLTNIKNDSQTLGIILTSGKDYKLDSHAKHEIDKLVPIINKIPTSKMIKIEGFYNIANNKENKTNMSLYLAKEAVKYLREKHKFNRELYIAAMNDNITTKGNKVLRISFFTTEYGEEKIEITRKLTDTEK